MAVAPLGKILLYIDATESARTAARYAIAIAKHYGAELHAVYVVNETMLEQLRHAQVFTQEEQVDLARELEEDGKRYLAFVEKLAREKSLSVTVELRKGIVHREVVDKAANIGACLIVMGEIEEPLSRRDSFYDEGEMILMKAKCPVLVVKGETMIDDFYDSI
jgi:nucleotide-binding universal stress UspA family protein